MKILIIGDIVGKTGRMATRDAIKELRKEHSFDLIIANGENIAHGMGMTKKTFEEMKDAGIDFFTSGNHIYDKEDIFSEMEKKLTKVIRPANFPEGNIGHGYRLLNIKKKKVLIINLTGRVFFKADYDCPFKKVDEILDKLKNENPDIILVDFHAEATSEKIALKHHLDGRITALWGTHTHVQTNDAEITEKGMAYISDIGMVGAKDGVIGGKKEEIIQSFLLQTKTKIEMINGNSLFSGIIIDTEKKAKSITKINIEEEMK